VLRLSITRMIWVTLGIVWQYLAQSEQVNFHPAFGDFSEMPSKQWFCGHEHIAGVKAAVIIVISGWSLWGFWNGLAGFANQLARCFVHAYHRIIWIVGTPIKVKHPLHCRYEVCIVLRRNPPTNPSPCLKIIFLERDVLSRERRFQYNPVQRLCQPIGEATIVHVHREGDHN